MSEYIVADTDLTSVANAIRTKAGLSVTLEFPSDFVSAIASIPTGTTPTGTKQLTISSPGSFTEDVSSYAYVEVTTPGGTAGTPTATKGTVSNHSVSVTPSVTNSAGFIYSGTQNGTAVSVTASELVSGTLPITQNGTVDVTNYASASVAVPTPTLVTKTITANGTYSASSDNADGYSSVTVDVQSGSGGTTTVTIPNGYISECNIAYTDASGNLVETTYDLSLEEMSFEAKSGTPLVLWVGSTLQPGGWIAPSGATLYKTVLLSGGARPAYYVRFGVYVVD